MISFLLFPCADRLAFADEADELLAKGADARAKGDTGAAIRSYTDLIRLRPDFAEAYYGRARAYERKRDHDKAIADYTKAIELKPRLVEAYNGRANAYDEKGDHGKAVADYTEAIRLRPEEALLYYLYYNRGLAYSRKGDLDKAVADYTEALKLKPDDALTYCNRGVVYRKKGELDKAIADYTDAIRLKHDYALAYNDRGYAYQAKGDLEKAIADYTEVIRIRPDYPGGYVSRGIASGLKGDTARSEADLAEARRLAAKSSKSLHIVAPVSAPIVYEDLMLLLSNVEGVGAIAFTEEIDYGVKYRYRYLPRRGKEESGEGKVFQTFKGMRGGTMIEAGGKVTLKAGPLRVMWLFREAGKGNIYYFPEQMRVEIARARDFEKIDLRRFMRSNCEPRPHCFDPPEE